ncbi:hypothetical protein HKX48_008562, partial [Thoreauomyces humboldtii]
MLRSGIPDASAQDFLSRALRYAEYANGPLNLDESQFLPMLEDLDLDVNAWDLQLQRDINEPSSSRRNQDELARLPEPDEETGLVSGLLEAGAEWWEDVDEEVIGEVKNGNWTDALLPEGGDGAASIIE